MIRHVESYTVGTRPHDVVPEIVPQEWDQRHYFYRLGPPIVPPHVVKTGKIYPTASTYVALDLLLTCTSVAEARDLTKARLTAAGV